MAVIIGDKNGRERDWVKGGGERGDCRGNKWVKLGLAGLNYANKSHTTAFSGRAEGYFNQGVEADASQGKGGSALS